MTNDDARPCGGCVACVVLGVLMACAVGTMLAVALLVMAAIR